MEGRPRLESWKEISSYLRRSVSTCQRWEAELGLPIYRLDGTPSARVFALPDELDAWIAEKLHSAEISENGAVPVHGRPKWFWIVAGGVVLTLAAAGFLAWQRTPRIPLGASIVDPPNLVFLPFADGSGDGSLRLWTTAVPQLLSLDCLQSRYAGCSPLSDNLIRLKELDLLKAKKLTVDDLKTIGAADPEGFLVTGNLVRSGKDIIVDAALLDAGTAEPVHMFRAIARGEEGVFAAVDELTRIMKIGLNTHARSVTQDTDEPVSRITTGSLEALTAYHRGILLEVDSKTAEAVTAYQQSVRIDPGFAEAHFRLFLATRTLARSCDCAWAREEAGRAGNEAFEYSDRLNLWAQGYLTAAFYLEFQRDVPRAIAEFKRLLGAIPDDPVTARQLAQIYWDLEDYTRLISLLEDPVMKEDPQNVRLLANSYMRTGNLDKAEMTWEAFRRTHPDAFLYDQELLALARGRFDQALAHNDRLRSDPRTPRDPVQYTRGPIFVAMDDLPGAETEFRAMVERDTPAEQVAGRLYLAQVLMREGRLAEAGEEARAAALQADALEDDLLRSRSHLVRAYILRLANDLGGALAESDEACRLSQPGGLLGLKPLHLKGLILLDLGLMADFEKVIDKVKTYVDRIQYPRLMRAYYHLLGEREFDARRFDRAIDYFWKAINLLATPYGHDLDIDSSRYYFSLAESYERTGQFETALETYRKIPFTWAQKLDAGDLYARSSYSLGRTHDQRLATARWPRNRPDTHFGIDGKVTLPAGMMVGNMAVQIVDGEERIVVGGGMPGSGKAPGVGVIVRYLPNGTLDPAFGTGGIAKFSPGNKLGGIQGVAIQPDQKIVVAGVAAPLSKPDNMNTLPTIARYTVNGALDTSFGRSGVTQLHCAADGELGGDSYAVVVQSDGKIAALTFFAQHMGVCRLNPDGTPDLSFNGSGQYFEPRSSCAFDIAIQRVGSEERILISGNIDGGPSSYQKAVLMRFTGLGRPDPDFGRSGYVIGDYRPYDDGYSQTAIDASNRILVCWGADDQSGFAGTNGLARHDPDGSLDPTFGSGGILTPIPGGDAWEVKIEPGPPEQILVAGLMESSAAVWRLTAGGTLDATFGSNGIRTMDFGGAGARALVLLSTRTFVVLADGCLVRYWR